MSKKQKKQKILKQNIVSAPYTYKQTKEMACLFFENWMKEQTSSYDLFSFGAFLWKKNHRKKEKKINPEVSYIAYDFVGYPNQEQETLLKKTIGCCRFIWNKMKADKDNAYKTEGKSINPKPADYKKEFPWLKEVDSISLCNVQLNLESAYKSFFKKEKGYPNFKKKHLCKDSYTTNISNKEKANLRLEGDLLTLPKFKDPIRVKVHREILPGGTLKKCTVTLTKTGIWHFALLFEYPVFACSSFQKYQEFLETGDISKFNHVGLDMSLPHLFVSSDDTRPSYQNQEHTIVFDKYYRRLERRIAKEQRKLSHMEKNSSNYRKQCRKIARLHAKAKQQRNDFLHQLSIRLVRKYDIISIENLDMSAMKQALRFGKSVSDNGWGKFVTLLYEKAEKNNCLIVKISRWFPSSKKCSSCGYIHKELKLGESDYICPKCGHAMDRDEQAAGNIDEEGLNILLGFYETINKGKAA